MVLRPNQAYPENMTQNQPPYGQGQQYSGYQPQCQYPPQGQYQNQYPPQGQYQNQYPPQGQYQNQYPPQGQYPPQNQYPPQSQQYGENASYYGHNQQDQRPAPSQEQPSIGSAGSPPPVPPHPSASAPPAMNPNEEERGVMGALAGGAAGAYAGHKMGHGIIGGLGGAYAGHKLEDAWKHHHNKPPSPQPPKGNGPPPAYSGPSSYSGPPAHMEGNFSQSSINIGMDRNYELRASCRSVDGSTKDTVIRLNRVLSNDNGRFVWRGDGGNFAASARNVRLVEDGRVLEAELRNVEGHWQWARVWLDEKIGNDNGQLVFV